jgi:hypothetical protein
LRGTEDRTPVILNFSDVNNDGMIDMVVNVKNEALIYLNRGDRLGLMTRQRACFDFAPSLNHFFAGSLHAVNDPAITPPASPSPTAMGGGFCLLGWRYSRDDLCMGD